MEKNIKIVISKNSNADEDRIKWKRSKSLFRFVLLPSTKRGLLLFFFLPQTALVLKEDGLVQGNVRQIEREEKERGRKKVMNTLMNRDLVINNLRNKKTIAAARPLFPGKSDGSRVSAVSCSTHAHCWQAQSMTS